MISVFLLWFDYWTLNEWKTEKVKYRIILSRYANYLHKQEFIQATLMSVVSTKNSTSKSSFESQSSYIYF